MFVIKLKKCPSSHSSLCTAGPRVVQIKGYRHVLNYLISRLWILDHIFVWFYFFPPQWNAVALWAWDIVVDNCAICRNHIMDLCEFTLIILVFDFFGAHFDSKWGLLIIVGDMVLFMLTHFSFPPSPIRHRVPGQPSFCNLWRVHCSLGCLQRKSLYQHVQCDQNGLSSPLKPSLFVWIAVWKQNPGLTAWFSLLSLSLCCVWLAFVANHTQQRRWKWVSEINFLGTKEEVTGSVCALCSTVESSQSDPGVCNTDSCWGSIFGIRTAFILKTCRFTKSD